MPTSLRFASGTFKVGGDPYAMYRTLTHGFGLMPPQPGLVPRQKYDVIHYIREAYRQGPQPASISQGRHAPISQAFPRANRAGLRQSSPSPGRRWITGRP